MRWSVLAAILLLGPWLYQNAQAQEKPRFGFGRGGFAAGRLLLLNQESVQADLKLTEEQKAKVRALQESQRQAFRELLKLGREEAGKRLRELAEKTDKELASILQPEQAKRLKQIQLQLALRGGNYRSILTDPELSSQLSVTDQQKEKVRQLDAEAAKLFKSLRSDDREEALRQLKDLNSKYESILTDQQKAKLRELAGEPFKGDIRFDGGKPRKPGQRPRKPANP